MKVLIFSTLTVMNSSVGSSLSRSYFERFECRFDKGLISAFYRPLEHSLSRSAQYMNLILFITYDPVKTKFECSQAICASVYSEKNKPPTWGPVGTSYWLSSRFVRNPRY